MQKIMFSRKSSKNVTLLLILGVMGWFAGCAGDDSSTTTTITISAPTLVSPATGSTVSETQPTLTVTNVTVSDGSTPTYTFQVATDSGFANIVAQASGIAQGSGQTTWQVTVELSSDQHFWRARARAGDTDGPFSTAADFTVGSSAAQQLPGVVIFDPLTNGTTLGERHGGQFTTDGWKVNANSDFIRYEVNSISNGFVQWENTGFSPRGRNDASHMLFGMWDPSVGPYRSNDYRVHLQKLWSHPHNPPFIRFRWISRGQLHDDGHNFTSWNPAQAYTWKIQWGSGVARVYLDGQQIMEIHYTRTYQPNTHWIELGVGERNESVLDAVYRNLQIGEN